MAGWFRVPHEVAMSLDGSRVATRAEAIADLLGRWHLGMPANDRTLRSAWRWSHDRVASLVREMAAWCLENKAECPLNEIAPTKIDQRPTSDRPATDQRGSGTTPESRKPPTSDRPATDQRPTTPRARDPLLEREETRETGDPDLGTTAAAGCPPPGPAELLNGHAHPAPPPPVEAQPRSPPPPAPIPTTSTPEPHQSPPPEAQPDPSPPKPAKPGRAPKAKPRAHPGYSEAIAAWDEEYRAHQNGLAYPWLFAGQHSDGGRVKLWLSAARVTAENPSEGVERIRVAVRAYLQAVAAGTAWPKREPPQTKHFTASISRWLMTAPSAETAKPHHQSLAAFAALASRAASTPEAICPAPTASS